MATTKLVTLAIKTLAKPIATQLKQSAVQHESFRKYIHRSETRLRANLMPGSDLIKIRPLNDAKGFLFLVAASLIVGESYRSSRSRANKHGKMEDEIDELRKQIAELTDGAGAPLHENSLHTDDLTPAPVPAEVAKVGGDHEALYSLMESVKMLWKLAERNGWLDDKQLTQELQWTLDGPAEAPPEGPADDNQAMAKSQAPKDDAPPRAPPMPSATAQQLGRVRAQAIIDEIRQQTAPTPIQIPKMPSPSNQHAYFAPASLLSWLPSFGGINTFFSCATAPSFDFSLP